MFYDVKVIRQFLVSRRKNQNSNCKKKSSPGSSLKGELSTFYFIITAENVQLPCKLDYGTTVQPFPSFGNLLWEYINRQK
jgi:hypothetical protein